MSKRKLLKAYPFLEEVDSFSLDVALAIYKVRPHWLNIGKVGEFRGRKYLSIEITSLKHPGWFIGLYTENYEITVVYYRSFHVHFSRGRPSLELALKESFEFIDDLMREKWVVGYVLLESNNPYGHAYSVEDMPSSKTDKVHFIRSWLGTYDRNLLEE